MILIGLGIALILAAHTGLHADWVSRETLWLGGLITACAGFVWAEVRRR